MNHSGTFLTPRSPDEVFNLLANLEEFAPLLPDFESMTMVDPTHFSLRIAIALGEMSGHANLAMELMQAERATSVLYRGQGIVAGSQLNLVLQFQIAPAEAATEVSWRGEFSLDGGLAFVFGSFIEPMGRKHFERMAERLRERLNPLEPIADVPASPETCQ
jgi:carbon monoxide dehydrogenase subunit G